MGLTRRVTLRCLCDDLVTDWGDGAQRERFIELRDALEAAKPDTEVLQLMRGLPSPAMADHPLVRSFSAQFAANDGEVRRESISGLNDTHWWKVKTGRWRGAATDSLLVADDDEVWLCAGGMRAQGENATSTLSSRTR